MGAVIFYGNCRLRKQRLHNAYSYRKTEIDQIVSKEIIFSTQKPTARSSK